jgi:hypothetical protein
VKYKLIPSLSHNLTHSFMSGMNYFDNDHVYLDVYALARAKPGHVVRINWIPATTTDLFSFPPRIQESIRAYRERLPALMKRHRISPEMVVELRTEVYVGKNFQMYVRAVAVDERGRKYSQFVWS